MKSMTGTGFDFRCQSVPPLPPLNVAERGSMLANMAETVAIRTWQSNLNAGAC
jgi:hypothetical protein